MWSVDYKFFISYYVFYRNGKPWTMEVLVKRFEIDLLVKKFTTLLDEAVGLEAKAECFVQFLDEHQELISCGGVRAIFRPFFQDVGLPAINSLISCQPESGILYLTIEDMIMEYYIQNDGVGGASIEDVFVLLKETRTEDWQRIVESIAARLGKLSTTTTFGYLFHSKESAPTG